MTGIHHHQRLVLVHKHTPTNRSCAAVRGGRLCLLCSRKVRRLFLRLRSSLPVLLTQEFLCHLPVSNHGEGWGFNEQMVQVLVHHSTAA